MDIARRWREAIVSHPNFKAVQADDSGFYAITQSEAASAGLGAIDTCPLTGITVSLRERFWPKATYKHQPKHAPGVPRTREVLRRLLNPTTKRIQRSPTRKTRRAALRTALQRGTLIHDQFAAYVEIAATTVDPAAILQRFEEYLSTSRNKMCHPGTRWAIQLLNEKERLRLAPIVGDLPLCDLPRVQSGAASPCGTAADAVVFDALTQTICVLELKTTNAAFAEGTHNMEEPLSFLTDSPLNRGRVQVAATAELFRRTYASILGSARVSAAVMHVDTDTGFAKLYYLSPEEVHDIVEQLTLAGWFADAKHWQRQAFTKTAGVNTNSFCRRG